MNLRGLARSARSKVRQWRQRRLPASPIEVERAEQTFYIQRLQSGMIVFDVGANVGELTLMFSRFVGPSGQVHAFEASRRVFGRLSTIVNLACKKNIILNNVALGDKEGTAKLHVYDEDHFGMHTMADRPLQDYGLDLKPVEIEEVAVTTLDLYCEKRNIARIDLLKVDVEGAELQVLRGATALLEKQAIRCCVFEFGQTTFDMGATAEEIEALFRRFSYRIRNVVRGNPVFPGRESAKAAQFSVHVAEPV